MKSRLLAVLFLAVAAVMSIPAAASATTIDIHQTGDQHHHRHHRHHHPHLTE
ncbi:MAG: hypothetical protein WBF06_16685 [Candidatus Acidiferrales bacterium]